MNVNDGCMDIPGIDVQALDRFRARGKGVVNASVILRSMRFPLVMI